MHHKLLIGVFFLSFTILISSFMIQNPHRPIKSNLKPLFNGKNLEGWDTYLGPELDESGKPKTKIPMGLNHDPAQVFSVVKLDGKPCIRISGEEWGGLISKKEYGNFHLRLKFKWGNLQFGNKRKGKKDSGLLYYSVGDLGADAGAWMRSQEFQIEEGNCGEFWGVAGGSEDIHAIKKSDSSYIYDPTGPLIRFNEDTPIGRHCKKAMDHENPTGEWNTLDLYCFEGKSIHMVNGQIMMILENSGELNHHVWSELRKGKIQFQSEGCEIFYRDIQLEEISEFPHLAEIQ